MRRAWTAVVTLSLWACMTPGSSLAGTFDALKGLGIDPKAILQPKPNAVEFQFRNFALTGEPGEASRSWTVEIRIDQPIEGNVYLVKSAVQGRSGETLFAGEEIPLPAAQAGKVFRLTRPMRTDSAASTVFLQVYNQVERRVAATQSYPLSAIAGRGIRGVTTSRESVRPSKGAESAARIDTSLDVEFLFRPILPGGGRQLFHLRNKSAVPVRIEALSGGARFLMGVEQEVSVYCPREIREIRPGQSVDCSFDSSAVDCPTLSAIWVDATLNGVSHRGELQLEAPIARISSEPVIQLTTRKKDTCCQYGNGSGEATVFIQGSYVRPGTSVTMKAYASLSSDRFPVLFTGTQQDDGIHARVEVVGARENSSPGTFCFHLMEITTCDDLRCGGIGVLLYRNTFNNSEWNGVSWGNLFLLQKLCK